MFREELERLEGIDFNKEEIYTFDVDASRAENFGNTVLELKNIAEDYGCECFTEDGSKFSITCKGSNIEKAHEKVLQELHEAKVSTIHEGKFLLEGFNLKFYRVSDNKGTKYGVVSAYDESEALDLATGSLKESVDPENVVITEADDVQSDEVILNDEEDNVDLSDIMSEGEFSDIVYFDNSKLFVGFNEKETGFWIGQDKDGTLVKIEGPFASREGAVDFYNQHPELESQSKEESLKETKDGSYEGDYAIFVNGDVYCDGYGEPYHFETAKEAEDFIKEHELENAEVTRQYGKANKEESLTEDKLTFKNDKEKQTYARTRKNLFTRYYKLMASTYPGFTNYNLQHAIRNTYREVKKHWSDNYYPVYIDEYLDNNEIKYAVTFSIDDDDKKIFEKHAASLADIQKVLEQAGKIKLKYRKTENYTSSEVNIIYDVLTPIYNTISKQIPEIKNYLLNVAGKFQWSNVYGKPFESDEPDGEYYPESITEAVDYTQKTSQELKQLLEVSEKKLDELITKLDNYVKQHRVEVDCNGDKLLVTTIKKSELGAPILQGMWRKNEIGKDLKDCKSITIDKRGVDQISKNEFEVLKQQVIEEYNRATRIGEARVLKMNQNATKAIKKHEYVEPTKDEIKFLVDNITRIYVSVSEEHYDRDIDNLKKRIPQFDDDMIDKYVKVKKGQWALAIKAHLKTIDGLPLSIEDSVEPEKKMMNNTYKLASVINANWDVLKDRISKDDVEESLDDEYDVYWVDNEGKEHLEFTGTQEECAEYAANTEDEYIDNFGISKIDNMIELRVRKKKE